jgi:trehalose synthase
VTKAMHNGLQGMPVPWNAEMQQVWRDYNLLNARRFDGEYDFVIIHDPQPAGILAYWEEERGERAGYWVWRCHIDLTETRPEIWEFVDPWVERYDGAIFTLQGYVPPELQNPRLFVIPPAIDPLAPKNAPLAPEACRSIIASYNIDPDRPYLLQVSRFDPWKDPLGVVDVYRLSKQVIPELQLVYVASMASDDPEGWLYFERTARRAGEDPDIHLLSNIHGVGNAEVNAFQSLANVIIQKSTREGFGLSVTEALWKARPTVALGRRHPLQVLDGDGPHEQHREAVERVICLQHQEGAAARGRSARHVRLNSSRRYLRDYLQHSDASANQTRRGLSSLIGRAATISLREETRCVTVAWAWWRNRRGDGVPGRNGLGLLADPLGVWWRNQADKAPVCRQATQADTDRPRPVEINDGLV